MTCGNHQSYGFDIKQWLLVTTKGKKSFNDILYPLWSTLTIWHRGELIKEIYIFKISTMK
jgi:hypothetical protein